MADKLRDTEDRALEALFSGTPIADDGFSNRVVAKIRRRQRFRHVCLSVALIIGSAIALKPAIAMLGLLYRMLFDPSTSLFAFSIDWIPSLNMIITGGFLFVVLMLGLRLIED